jgi:hypothetical protein
MGILVNPAKKASKAERGSPRWNREDGERQIPWLWIAVGGSAGWVVIILVIALVTRGQERIVEQELAPMPLPRAVDGPLADAAPRVVQQPVAVDVGVNADVRPAGALKPKLQPKQIKQDDGPPPIDIAPVEIIQEAPAPVKAAAAPAPVLPGAARNKDIDLNLFANCQQIGTDVLFVKDPPKAFLKAKDEKRMVCMVHLSGNLEDPGFT